MVVEDLIAVEDFIAVDRQKKKNHIVLIVSEVLNEESDASPHVFEAIPLQLSS